MSNNSEPSRAQLRAADCLAAAINTHTRRALETGTKLFPSDAGLADRLRAEVEIWCKAHPDPGATIEQASTHEGGHLLGAGLLGLAPASARVRGTRGAAKGYGGYAIALARPLAPEAWGTFTADDVKREAIFALAGLLAEWWLAGGDPYASPSEILESGILAARLADMLGLDRVPVLADVFKLAMQLVVTFREQIEQIAGILKRKRMIFSETRGVAQALKSIVGRNLADLLPLTAEQDVALGAMMRNAPVDLARFTEQVGR